MPLWTNKCCSHVPDVLGGLVLRIGDAEQSPNTLMFKCLYLAFYVRVKRPGFEAVSRKETTWDL
ncbi:hypothetical protein DPMN_056291 [Dreissena polymorpha]|uniref:Uncharacterized protein n=1 Tax=Dreissena polymorpha TaxID=45954 RepID=A0A9D4CRF0_DREPO|nr:hypothetical protein DPMN_056291 [Dreissena polymorpha]